MTKQQFNKQVKSLPNIVADVSGLELVYKLFDYELTNVIQYRHMADMMITAYLREIGREKKWTWYDDLATSEWFVANGMDKNAVLDTCKHALKYWHDNEHCMAEFLFALSMKCNEHYERQNKNWCEYYGHLFYFCRDLVYDYYANDSEKTGVVYRYLD